MIVGPLLPTGGRADVYLDGKLDRTVDAYPDDTSRRSAEILAAATSAKFDGSDLMPNAMNQAFFEAIVAYVQNPGDLDNILSNLDNVQADAYGG